MTIHERASWLERIAGKDAQTQSWVVDVSIVERRKLPLIDRSAPEDSPEFDQLVLTVEPIGYGGDSLVTIHPKNSDDKVLLGIAARISQEGNVKYFSESLIEINSKGVSFHSGFIDGVGRGDPSGEEFLPSGLYSDQASRLDSFLRLVTASEPKPVRRR